MELDDVVMKLTGPVVAIGESNIDRERLENLKTLTDLVDSLLYRIHEASRDANRHEASMKLIGQTAQAFLDEVKNS